MCNQAEIALYATHYNSRFHKFFSILDQCPTSQMNEIFTFVKKGVVHFSKTWRFLLETNLEPNSNSCWSVVLVCASALRLRYRQTMVSNLTTIFSQTNKQFLQCVGSKTEITRICEVECCVIRITQNNQPIFFLYYSG